MRVRSSVCFLDLYISAYDTLHGVRSDSGIDLSSSIAKREHVGIILIRNLIDNGFAPTPSAC